MIPRKPITPDAARLRMASLCARGEHCEAEIREKLLRLRLPSYETDRIIDYLIENRFIDEERFARSFTRDKIRFSGWGRRKVSAALAMKRISRDAISQAFEEIEEEEYEQIAYKYSASKTRSARLDLHAAEDRARLFRSMASRGFEAAVIQRAISKIISESDKAPEEE